jgi:hypothetical protein
MLMPPRPSGASLTSVLLLKYRRKTSTTRRVSVRTDGGQANSTPFGSQSLALSADGRFVAFDSDASNLVPGDTNGTFDVFVRSLAP